MGHVEGRVEALLAAFRGQLQVRRMGHFACAW